MDRHISARRQRTLAVPLIALVVMCFMCALCHSTGLVAQPAFTVTAVADCPKQPQETVAVTAMEPAPEATHPCEATEERGLPTMPPLLLIALGVVLVFALLLAPRPGPASRPASRTPFAHHGYGLLILLCVQRV